MRKLMRVLLWSLGGAVVLVIALLVGVRVLYGGGRVYPDLSTPPRLAADRLEVLHRAGVRTDQLILDPGPDLYKAPDETVTVLRAVPRLRRELGIDRVLWAVSRKDFVGALTGRMPKDRGSGTLGALSSVDLQDQDLIRVHDVAGTVDFLTVRAALHHGLDTPLEMDDAIRYDLR